MGLILSNPPDYDDLVQRDTVCVTILWGTGCDYEFPLIHVFYVVTQYLSR